MGKNRIFLQMTDILWNINIFRNFLGSLTKYLNFKKLFVFFVSDACVRSKKSGRLTYQIWTCRKSAHINQNIIDVSVWNKFVLYFKSTLINHKSFGKIRYFLHPQKNPQKYSNFRAVTRDSPFKVVFIHEN